MTVEIPQRVQFLKKVHLFRGIDDTQLSAIAGRLEEETLEDGVEVIRQGMEGGRFYLIQSGKVDVTRKGPGDTPVWLATLIPGDYFGEEELIRHTRRTATITTLGTTVLFSLDRQDMHNLLEKVPKLRPNLEIAVSSRRLSRSSHFKWLQKDEVIYFLARKHPVELWESLFVPLLVTLIPILILFFYLVYPFKFLLILGIFALIASLGWIGWKYLDWTNDYYIVTNRRAIWLEKVIGLYDSRQEAPLTTILSVGVETSQLGRILDFGDVVIRTFVGKIQYHRVSHPYQAASMIEEHWIRSREGARKSDLEAMRQTLREKLGMAAPKPTEPVPVQEIVSPHKRVNALKLMLPGLFKTRYEEEGGVITYRKHLFVLFQKTWAPALVLLLLGILLLLTFTNLSRVSEVFKPATVILLLLFLMFCVLLWYIYRYVDWNNDKFQVTQDQIFDIDRRPFGLEERKAAALDNILSTEYKREGFLQVMLNYGNVYITVGGTQMVFENVANPPSVQADIDQRRIARLERKKQADALAERERMADWIATYHRSVADLGQQDFIPPLPDEAVEEERGEEDDENDVELPFYS